LGSTDIARIHWEAMAIAAAISGTLVVVGENVCGMDPMLKLKTAMWSGLRRWNAV
jgi:hypothetical protein